LDNGFQTAVLAVVQIQTRTTIPCQLNHMVLKSIPNQPRNAALVNKAGSGPPVLLATTERPAMMVIAEKTVCKEKMAEFDRLMD